jgi:hypothetical protein
VRSIAGWRLREAAGAKKDAITESNYGKAPQFTSSLADGEAYLWCLCGHYGGGFAVKTKNHLLIFDKTAVDDSLESGLANGRLNPHELAGQKITGLITKIRGAAFESRPYDIAGRLPDVNLVVDSDNLPSVLDVSVIVAVWDQGQQAYVTFHVERSGGAAAGFRDSRSPACRPL